jgi:hypothetical protein
MQRSPILIKPRHSPWKDHSNFDIHISPKSRKPGGHPMRTKNREERKNIRWRVLRPKISLSSPNFRSRVSEEALRYLIHLQRMTLLRQYVFDVILIDSNSE